MSNVKWTVLVAACLALATSDVFGTTLIFEPATGSFADFAPLPQGYGNRVTSTTQDGYKYDLNGGPTPNVVTRYATGSLPTLYTWANDFGDLQHVVFAQEAKVFEMDLVADPGFLVTLNSFDMAGWPHLDFTINFVKVLDGSGNVLYSQNLVDIEGAQGQGEPEHTHFDFGPLGLTASTLRIMYDSTTDGSGHTLDSDDVGIDNINFGQFPPASVVPEPGTLTLLGIGGAALAAGAWWRKRRLLLRVA